MTKLKNKVKSQSVNSLGNIYPEDIVEWLQIPAKEVRELVEDLHSQRIITYKYKLKCSCGEVCTIYENKLIHSKTFQCKVCGNLFSLDDIKAAILYEIDKEELLSMEEEVVDFMVTPETIERHESILQKKEEATMEIFMGSSSEAIDYMDEIAVKLEELGTTPLLWNASGKGIFIPGDNTIDALIKITKRVQAAVFIFNADDKTWNGKSALESCDSVRDNVLFEYGLFLGALDKGKVCFVCKGNPRIASDLKGITYIDGDSGESIVKMKLRDWINNIKA